MTFLQLRRDLLDPNLRRHFSPGHQPLHCPYWSATLRPAAASSRWACSVAILSRVAAVSWGVQPCASDVVTRAANAASNATSQLTSRSGFPSGKIGGSTDWDM